MTLTHTHIISFLLWLWQLVFFLTTAGSLTDVDGSWWDLLLSNIGVAAMHMQLLKNDRVIIFDRTDFGTSNISLPDGKCRHDPNDTALTIDCSSHSVEYDIHSNTIRPLMVLTDVWCSSGSVMSNGRLIQTGGFNDGGRAVRTFRPCSTCDWKETNFVLTRRRWYATNHLLPNGRQIIVGGRRQFNYEFYPKTDGAVEPIRLRFLAQTNDPNVENNLYPFVHLNVDGNLFIFANNRAILFNYLKNKVVKMFPEIPGGDPRCYPSSGSSVLLPLNNLQGPAVEVEVLICGGAPKGSYISAKKGQFIEALDTCARMKITDPSPKWIMEKMPIPRVMGDMVLLPDGNVLIINGGSTGTAGWELGRYPVLAPVIYRPDNPTGSRFSVLNPTTIPRMYHSTALVLPDGRVLVAGSNPHVKYQFKGVLYPTELRLESFSPSYLDSALANLRPRIISPVSRYQFGYKKHIPIRFTVPSPVNSDMIKVTMISPPFVTHTFSMNQRLLILGHKKVKDRGNSTYELWAIRPDSVNLAPSGYYLLYVVHQDIPSEGVWIHHKRKHYYL